MEKPLGWLDWLLGLLPWSGGKTIIGVILTFLTSTGFVSWLSGLVPGIPAVEVQAILVWLANFFLGAGVLHWKVKQELGR